MRAVTPVKRLDLLILCAILVVAGWMRLGRDELVEYFHDDAMLATLALEMTDGEQFPVTGILSSTGIPNPPTSVYVMAIPFSISSDPMTAIRFIMLLNVIGVGLLWLLAHRYFGRQVAIVASLAYAVNPWAVLFSRKIWAQDFHTPFILLGILLLLYGYVERHHNHRWQAILAQVCSLPLLVFAFQIHFASWAIASVILVALWIGRKHIIWRALLLGIVLSIIAVAPYIVGLTQTLDQDPTRITDAAERTSAAGGLSLTADPITYSIYLTSGIGLETWVAPDQQDRLTATYPPLTQAGLLFTGLMTVGVVVLWRKYRHLTIFLLVWAFLPQIALTLNWTPVYAHYFIPSIPAMFLLAGIGFTAILQRLSGHRIIIGFLWGLILVVLGLQVMMWHAILDYVETHHIPYPGFTIPIGDLNPIRDTLKQSDDVIIVSQGMSWNLHHEVAVWDTLLWDASCVRTIVPDGYAVFPAHPFVVVTAPDAPHDPINNLYATDKPLHFDTREGDNGYTVNQWDTLPPWTGPAITEINGVLFDNGVQLTGYALENDTVYLEWRLPGRHKGANYQYSAQLFDASGNRLAQLDKTFWHGRHWCENDRLITWGTLPSDADATILKVSMYILGTGKDTGQFFNANILDKLGNPSGQSVDIPLN